MSLFVQLLPYISLIYLTSFVQHVNISGCDVQGRQIYFLPLNVTKEQGEFYRSPYILMLVNKNKFIEIN